jgi:chromosome segregation protein
MRLKSLEVLGFKSFLEPTLIGFAPGITAVVGPNGCGKSNVVDAIRWVLGEQAPTRLRGKSTEDLIYIGNDANPAAGMAEVSLNLEAEEGSALPDPYSALSEVSVTRRVYRSGDSEYFLNRIPCRLKDITEFFMAAQIHSRGYSLIEQGKIEEIIQAKPAELRSLVEEAAGLSLFKGRREISERKLERVRENLDRLNDVLAEIDRQLNFAQRQAKKAEAYKVIRSELEMLDWLLAGRRLIDQTAELAAHSRRESELSAEAEILRASIADACVETDRQAEEVRQLRERFAAVSQEVENLRAGIAERARARNFIERRLAQISELEPASSARAEEAELKATLARASRAELSARLARETNVEDGTEAALDGLRERHLKAVESFAGAEQRVEEIRDAIGTLMGEATALRNRLGEYSGERAELAQRVMACENTLPELKSAIEAFRGELAEGQQTQAIRRDAVATAEAELELATQNEMEARAMAERQDSRELSARDSLERAIAGAERLALNGAGRRLRTVLDSLNGDGPAKTPSFLMDVIKAPAALEPALRAVLGERLSAVIVESPRFAIRAVEILKETGGGRLSFVPETTATIAHAAITAPGISGRLIDQLSIADGKQQVAEAVLGHVLLADDIASALGASNLNGHGIVFVTREGDVVWPGEVVSGGSSIDPSAIDEVEGALSIGEAESALAQSEARSRETRAMLAKAKSARETAQHSLNLHRQSVTELDLAIARAQGSLARADSERAMAEAQRANARNRMMEIDAVVPATNARLEELARIEQSGRVELAAARAEMGERRASADKIGEEMLKLGAQLETRKSRLSAIQSELRHVGGLTAEIELQIASNHETVARLRAERIECDREIENYVAQDAIARARESVLRENSAELTAVCESRRTELDDQRNRVNAMRERLDSIEAEVVDAGLKRERAKALSEELARNFGEKFGKDFSTSSGEIENALLGRDREQDEARLAELHAKAERIGEVNLAADSEVRELEERSAALILQREDLEAAVRDLSLTIQKLNREARKRFAETFEGAARNFSELFPKLMRGGKARLELTDPNDLLESGVNILVQPAGKKVKEIGLLSGGEKALSAMALVFSLFLLNPSPFCVLDEVDAPLDEFSVAAFTSLICELKERSQFIVITHNQRTMQMADHIHGITMEQLGISRLISLKMPQAA